MLRVMQSLVLWASIALVSTSFASPAARELCGRLLEIRSIPFHPDGASADPIYTEMQNHHADLVECLIERVADTRLMPDPRVTPARVSEFRVGDLAFFLLSRFGYVKFSEVLPETVRERLPERGALAYFDWVNQAGQRQELQRRLRSALKKR